MQMTEGMRCTLATSVGLINRLLRAKMTLLLAVAIVSRKTAQGSRTGPHGRGRSGAAMLERPRLTPWLRPAHRRSRDGGGAACLRRAAPALPHARTHRRSAGAA